MGLLDLGIDDPNTTGLLSLGLRLMSTPGKFGTALGSAGLGAMGDMRQAQQLMELRQARAEQMKQEQLRQQMLELQLAQARQAQAEQEAMRTLAQQSARTPGQVAVAQNGGPTLAAAAAMPTTSPGFDWNGYAQGLAAINPTRALEVQQLLKKEQPKLKSVDAMRDPATGKMVNVALFEDGTSKVLPYGVKPEIALQTLGDRVVALDKNALPNGASFAMGQSPDSVASNKLGWANFGLSQDRLNFDKTKPENQYDPERGVIVNMRSGTASPVMQSGQPLGTKPKDLTDSQSKALLFGARALESNAILADLAKDGVDRPGNIKSVLEAAPLVGGGLGAIVNTAPTWAGGPNDQQQQVEQAQRDFVNAVLRRESGAVISPDEFDNARKQYFPQAGDSEAVKEQKKRNRETAVQGILQEVPDGRRPKLGGNVDDLVKKYATPQGQR